MTVVEGNLAVVRHFWEASADYIRGNHGPFETALLELCAPDIVMVPTSSLPSGDPGPFHGRESLLRQQQEVTQIWSDFELSTEEYVEVTPSTVVMLGKVAARRQDGSGYAMEIGIVNRLREGQIVSMHSYQSKRRALEQAGGPELVTRVTSD